MRHSFRITTFLLITAITCFGPYEMLAQHFPELNIEKYVLSNGMTVILKEDHRLPSIAVALAFHAGSACEQPGQTGYAHLFEHMMFQGTENVPGDYSGHFMEFGGSAGGMTSHDYTFYYDIIPSNYLERTLWIESDRLCNIAKSIKQERLDNQRSVVINERRQFLDNTPYSRMDEVTKAAVFPPDHPYSWDVVGRIADLVKADTSALIEFARQYYSPNNASLLIHGDFNSGEAKKLADKYFAAIPPGPPIQRPKQWIPELSTTKRVVMQDKVAMPRISFQWFSPIVYSEGDAEGIVLGKCLGDGVSSRLYRALVDEAGIAVTLAAYQGFNELVGRFSIEVLAREGQDLSIVEQLVDSVITDIIENGLTEAEVEAAKKQIIKQRLDRLQSSFAMAFMMNNYNVLTGEPDRFEWDAERFAMVTPKGVQEFAGKYLNLNRRVIVECYPYNDLLAEGELPDWSTPPDGKSDPVFTPPEIQEATLANGLKLLLVERHELPLVHAKVLVGSGYASDPAGRWGLATMVQALLDEGTKKRTIFEIEEEVNALGASTLTGVYTDGISVSLDVLKESFVPALDVVADMMMNSTIPERELANKKIKFTNVYRNNCYDPEETAIKVFNREFYGKSSPFGQPRLAIGIEESIEAITREEVVEFYERNFTPDNTTILIAGDMTLEEAKDIFTDAFGKWQPSGLDHPAIPAEPLPRDGRRILVVDFPEATQSVICIGNEALASDHPDCLTFEVMLSALCAYEHDHRINRVVREEKGYTYGLYMDYDSRSEDGLYKISGKVDTEHTAESVQLTLQAMEDITNSYPVTSEELGAIKKRRIFTYPSSFEDNGDIAYMMREIQLDKLPLDYWNQYLAGVKAIDSTDVLNAAQNYLHPENTLIVVVGDRSKIEQPLRDLNLGEVTVIE